MEELITHKHTHVCTQLFGKMCFQMLDQRKFVHLAARVEEMREVSRKNLSVMYNILCSGASFPTPFSPQVAAPTGCRWVNPDNTQLTAVDPPL